MTESVQRIPFGVKDEAMIGSAARWMRFMAIIQIVAGSLGLIALVIGLAVLGFIGTAAITSQLGSEDLSAAVVLAVFGAVMLLGTVTVVVSLWAGMLLYSAGDSFEQVAKTDIADQDYLADGFRSLRKFFYVEAVFAVLGAAQGVLGIFASMAQGA